MLFLSQAPSLQSTESPPMKRINSRVTDVSSSGCFGAIMFKIIAPLYNNDILSLNYSIKRKGIISYLAFCCKKSLPISETLIKNCALMDVMIKSILVPVANGRNNEIFKTLRL